MKVRTESVDQAGRKVWLYRTEGLSPARAEVAIALAALPTEERAPTEPVAFLEQSLRRAFEVAPLAPGRVDPIEPALLGFRGAGVVRSSVRARSNELDLVLLTRDEVAVAREQGLSCVLAALAEHSSPPVAVRGRASAVTPRYAAGSFLGGGLARVPGVFALVEERALTLVILEDAREALDDLLANAIPAASLCLAAEPHPDAGCWVRGAARPAPRGSAAFVAFAPQQTKDALELVEGGAVLLLTGASWSKLRAALLAGDDLELALSSGETLRLDWRDAWSDMVGAPTAPARGINIGRCAIFGTDEDVQERVGREPLDELIRATVAVAREGFAPRPELAQGVNVRGTLRPGNASVSWAVTVPQGLRGAEVDALLEGLHALRAPRATQLIAFEVVLEVAGGRA